MTARVLGRASAVSTWRLADFIADHQRLDAPAFRAEHGEAFLLHEGPLGGDQPAAIDQTTIGVTDRAGPRGGVPSQLDFLVYPLRRSERSRFSQFLSLGRGADNDIVISHPSVSTFHAFFTPHPDGAFVLQDGGSKNGTFIDEERAPARDQDGGPPLAPGSLVRVGSVELTYLLLDGFRQMVGRIGRSVRV